MSGTASVVFHLTPRILAAAADEIYGRCNFEVRGGDVQDPLIVHLANIAMQEITYGLSNSLILDHIANVVTARLVRAYAGLPEGTQWAGSRLSARQLCTLREFIESRLDVGTSVRQLAGVIGLGPQRLSALLKASTGFTPHAYVTHLRMVRAGQLLKQSHLALPEIALALGFAGQSHFGAVFRRYFGVTPQHYRKQAARPRSIWARPAASSG